MVFASVKLVKPFAKEKKTRDAFTQETKHELDTTMSISNVLWRSYFVSCEKKYSVRNTVLYDSSRGITVSAYGQIFCGNSSEDRGGYKALPKLFSPRAQETPAKHKLHFPKYIFYYKDYAWRRRDEVKLSVIKNSKVPKNI